MLFPLLFLDDDKYRVVAGLFLGWWENGLLGGITFQWLWRIL